jgi:protein-tyrosine phosphatase
MAMGLLRQRLVESGLDSQVQVRSAGVFALEGRPASQPGVEVLAERGVDISDHRGHTVSTEDMLEADLVLVMEEDHRRSLFYSYPHLLGKVFLLSEMAGEYGDVRDPYRQPKEAYEACMRKLDQLLEDGYDNILQRLGVEGEALER